MKGIIFVLVALAVLAGATQGWAEVQLVEDTCLVYVTPVSTMEETVFVFLVTYHDYTTGEPIEYFSPPVNITGSKSGSGKNDVFGNIAVRSARDESGRTHIVWMSNDVGQWEVYYALLDLDGTKLIEETQVSDPDTHHSAYPSIGLDSNEDAHVVWMDERDGDWEIYYSKVHPDVGAGQAEDLTVPDTALSDIDGFASGRWVHPDSEWVVVAHSETGNPIVAVHTNFPEHPEIVVDPSDTVHVVWSDHRNSHWKIYYQSQSTDSIPTVFFNDTVVSSRTYPVDEIYPTIAVGPRVIDYPRDWGVHIAWQRDAYGEWIIYYRKQHSSYPWPPLRYDQLEFEDTYHSTAPSIAVDDSQMAHIAFMDNRAVDPGHGIPLEYQDKNDIHINGYWEVYVAVLNTAGANEIRYFRKIKRESDLSSWYPEDCDSAWIEQWGNPVYGYYTGPGSCQDLYDAPSMFPRISSEGDFYNGRTKLVWQDIRNSNWDIYFTEFSNWCRSPMTDVRITNYAGPDKFPEISVSQTEHKDIQWQRQMPDGRWDIWDSRWQGSGSKGPSQYIKVEISSPYRQILSYYMYQVDARDTNARDGILYYFVRPPALHGYAKYEFKAENYLGEYTATIRKDLPLTYKLKAEEVEPSCQPGRFSLIQNYPNPFNPTTILRYQVPGFLHVTLRIYDLLGREVVTLVNEPQPAGSYTVEWDGRNNRGREVASGIYFYRLQAREHEMTRRMVLLR